MKIGMNVLLWTAHLTEEHFPILAKLKTLGYDGVELPVFQGEEQHYAAMGREIRRLGLGATAVTVMTPEANPASSDPVVRNAALDRLKWAIRCTAAIGGEVLCGPMHSALGVFSGAAPTDDERKWCAEVIRQAAEEARAANIRLAIEFLCRFESYVLTTAADAIALARRIDHPSVGLLYDTFHANIEEKDPAASLEQMGRHLFHMHISENDRGTPGRGHVPWQQLFAVLHKMRYRGWLTIEAFGRAMPEIAAATRVWRDFFSSADELCAETLEFLRRMRSGN